MYVLRKNGTTLFKTIVFGFIIIFCYSFIGLLSFSESFRDVNFYRLIIKGGRKCGQHKILCDIFVDDEKWAFKLRWSWGVLEKARFW